MSRTIRHPEILDIARRDGVVTVDGLAHHFNVTAQTIRRDLTDLAEAGRLERVHGGAVLPSGTVNIAYEERRRLNAGGKTAIARACAERIAPRSTVFLGIGTTTEAVATALRHHADLLVVTNNMNIANILSQNPDCRVVVTGGDQRQSDGGLTGAITLEAVGRFKFDVGVIGCSAIDGAGDVLDFDLSEVSVSRAILAQSRARVLVADRSKFGRMAPARVAAVADLDTFVTDAPVPRALQADCDARGTEVLVAG